MPDLPEDFLNMVRKLLGPDSEAFINAHEDLSRVTSVRVNPFKPAHLPFRLDKKVPWAKSGYYLSERPSFTYDPLFHAGCYYVQEAGSMFLEHAMLSTLEMGDSPVKILDACAAPGGKSTLINSLMRKNDLLVCNELIKNRSAILCDNISRWGTANTVVTNNETSKFSQLSGFFDAIILDAPCSGSGLFRKQPEAVNEWSVAAVKACSVRQKTIITDLLPALKPGGFLYYSTCSYSTEENEEIVAELMAAHDMRLVDLPGEFEGVIRGTGYRFYPHLVESEGFYLAVLQKPEGSYPDRMRARKTTTQPLSAVERTIINSIVDPGDLRLIKQNNNIHLLNEETEQFLSDFTKHFYFRKAGINAGEIKGRDLVPDQQLAWSNYLRKDVTRAELGIDDAIRYLKKEPLTTGNATSGLVLASYENQGIGWAKFLSNRVNNYLPSELKIRH